MQQFTTVIPDVTRSRRKKHVDAGARLAIALKNELHIPLKEGQTIVDLVGDMLRRDLGKRAAIADKASDSEFKSKLDSGASIESPLTVRIDYTFRRQQLRAHSIDIYSEDDEKQLCKKTFTKVFDIRVDGAGFLRSKMKQAQEDQTSEIWLFSHLMNRKKNPISTNAINEVLESLDNDSSPWRFVCSRKRIDLLNEYCAGLETKQAVFQPFDSRSVKQGKVIVFSNTITFSNDDSALGGLLVVDGDLPTSIAFFNDDRCSDSYIKNKLTFEQIAKNLNAQLFRFPKYYDKVPLKYRRAEFVSPRELRKASTTAKRKKTT